VTWLLVESWLSFEPAGRVLSFVGSGVTFPGLPDHHAAALAEQQGFAGLRRRSGSSPLLIVAASLTQPCCAVRVRGFIKLFAALTIVFPPL
jgi:hypothetical protein